MINAVLTMWCDQEGCYNGRLLEAKGEIEARAEARKTGWSCRSGFEFCPEHSVATDTGVEA